jgi:uncharacterized protein
VLGLSLSKILFTIMIIVAVWKGFALVSRLASERQAAVKRRRPPGGVGAGGRSERDRGQRGGAIELQECPRCGAYVDPREGCKCGVRGNETRRTGT